MEISHEKNKVLAFREKDPVQSKICLNNELLERANAFIYLGYSLCFTHDIDVRNKSTKFIKNVDTINVVMKPLLVQKHTRIKIYKLLARPVLAYGCEAWAVRKSDEARITAAEMRFMRRTAGYAKWDHI
jgi:hypothetical protein